MSDPSCARCLRALPCLSCLPCLIAAVVLTACGPPDRGPRFRPTGSTTLYGRRTLRFAIQGQVPTLDPTFGYDEFSYYILHALFDTLVDFAPVRSPTSSPAGLDIIPRLATSWGTSPDGKVYTFELRPGITFSDGTPITAAHFKFSLERALANDASPFGPSLGDIVGARDMIEGKAGACAGITTPNDRQLRIELVRANQALLAILAMPFATPQRAEHVARAGDQLRRQPDATGPFQLASWDEGNQIVLVRNPHHVDPTRAHLDAIVMRENIPRDTQLQLFERAELDTAEKLAGPDAIFVMNEPAWQPYIHHAVTMNAFGSRMNVQIKPFDDRRVRQALNYALDKAHTARLINGTTVPAHGILPPGMLGRNPDLVPYPHDIAKARNLLAQAGYPDGFDIEYLTFNDDEAQKVAESLQSDLAKVGIRVRLSVVSWATFQTMIGQPQGSSFSFVSWTADFWDPSNFFEPSFHSRSIAPEGSINNSFYANPELDALLDRARQELDPSKRDALYRRAERILYEDAPWIWDYHRVLTEVTQPYVQDYEPHPIWIRDYTSAWLDVGPDGAPVPR